MNRWIKFGLGAVAALTVAVPGVAAASATSAAPAVAQATPPPPPNLDQVGAQAAASNQGTIYVPLTPCRIVDTRIGTGTNGTPFSSLQTRTYYVGGTFGFAPQGGKSGGCGIPVGATAIAATLTAVNPSNAGYVRAWPNGLSEPTATQMQYAKASNASGATLTINASSAYALKVRNYGGPTDIIIDVAGYYTKQIYGTFSDTGTLYNGNGTLAAYSHSSTGYYTLKANRDITGCSVMANSYYYAYTVTGYSSGAYVYLEMTDYNGTPSNYYFHVQVMC